MDTSKINLVPIQNRFDSLENQLSNMSEVILPINAKLDSLEHNLSNTHNLVSDATKSIHGQLDNIGIADWLLLVIGGVFGLLISLGWERIKRHIDENKIKSICEPYEGIYISYEKYDQEQKPKYFLELQRRKNIFFVKSGISIIGHEDIDIEITMNGPEFKRGVGYYQHKRSPDGIIRFGFLEVQLAQDEILVHVTIHKDGKENSDAYRWIRIDDKLKDSEANKYREIQQKNRQIKFSNYL